LSGGLSPGAQPTHLGQRAAAQQLQRRGCGRALLRHHAPQLLQLPRGDAAKGGRARRQGAMQRLDTVLWQPHAPQAGAVEPQRAQGRGLAWVWAGQDGVGCVADSARVRAGGGSIEPDRVAQSHRPGPRCSRTIWGVIWRRLQAGQRGHELAQERVHAAQQALHRRPRRCSGAAAAEPRRLPCCRRECRRRRRPP
jgi:hypothetical protein